MVQTSVANQASASDALWIGALEVLASLSGEVCLFGLASLVYFSFTYSRPQWFASTPQKVQAQRSGAQEKRRQGGGGKHGTLVRKEPSAKVAVPDGGDVGDACGHKRIKEIRAFGKSKELAVAVAAFEDHVRNGGAATSLLYKAIMEACVECGDVEAAGTYFDQAKGKGLVDAVSYNILMKGRLAAGQVKCAERLLAELPREGLKATHASYHGLLNSRAMTGDLRGAWCMIDEMQAAGLTPNACTCSILLKGVTAPRHSADLLRISAFAGSMENEIDRPLLGALIEGCIRTRQGELGLKTLQNVRSASGDDLTLMAPAYGSMIKFFGTANDATRIWAVWHEMESQGVKPTAVTLGCMIEALVQNGCAHDAWKLVRQTWTDEGQRPLVNTITYSTLLKGFVRQPQMVQTLYKEMRDCGIECNAVTYNTILNVFAQNGDMHLVPALLEDMAKTDPPVDPDVITYATLIKGYCASGDVDRALKLFNDMKAGNKITPDDVMYHCLLDGFAKAQRVGDALQLYDDMVASGLTPSNFTLSILVKLLGRAKRLQQAFSLVEKVKADHGVRPNIQVYTCLMQACFQNKQAAKAVSLLDTIVEEGIKPDERTYSALVQGCLAAGLKDKALELAQRAFHGSRPVGIDAKVLKALTAKLGKEGEVANSLRAAAERLQHIGNCGDDAGFGRKRPQC